MLLGAEGSCYCPAQVVQIHERLAPGGILVFVTGQREVEHLCARLRSKYAKSQQAPSAAAVQPGELHARSALLSETCLSAMVFVTCLNFSHTCEVHL